jgi:transposase
MGVQSKTEWVSIWNGFYSKRRLIFYAISGAFLDCILVHFDIALDKIYTKIRQCIFKFKSKDDQSLSGEVEMDESYFGGKRKGNRGRGAKDKVPVFGILERNGKVKVEIVKDVSEETLLRETIRKVKRGSLIYTDKFKSYDSLVTYGFKHERIDKSVKFANGKVYINGIEGFWSYAKERLLKFHGVGKENFIYYLKELEFRYNFRYNLDVMLYNCMGGMK